jgi:hypothetical protein
MRSAYRITPRLVVALAVAGVTVVGWVARSTRAQDYATKDDPRQKASTPLVLPDNVPPPGDAAAPNPVGPENDDPERNARAFIEQNRKVAQGELKSLKDEAERLRTRLGKVEAGIRRWEALLAALDNGEKAVGPGIVPSFPGENPTTLEPAPVSRRAVVRESQTAPPSAPAAVDSPTTLEPPFEAKKPAEPPKNPAADNTPPPAKPGDLAPALPSSPGSPSSTR